MKTKSGMHGEHILEVEVTNISSHGFWLLVSGEEKFLSFDQFPWFRGANIGQILSVQMPGEGHLHWPDLDVDVSVESIDYPERFPLISRTPPVGAENMLK